MIVRRGWLGRSRCRRRRGEDRLPRVGPRCPAAACRPRPTPLHQRHGHAHGHPRVPAGPNYCHQKRSSFLRGHPPAQSSPGAPPPPPPLSPPPPRTASGNPGRDTLFPDPSSTSVAFPLTLTPSSRRTTYYYRSPRGTGRARHTGTQPVEVRRFFSSLPRPLTARSASSAFQRPRQAGHRAAL